MQVNKGLSQEIYNEAGTERFERAQRYVRQGRVDITKVIYDNPNNFEVKAIVDGNYDDYHTKIKVENGEVEVLSCECPDYYKTYGACKHIVATLLKLEQTKYWDKEEIQRRPERSTSSRFATFRKIVTELYNEELQEINVQELEQLPEDKKIKIEPRIVFDRFDSKLKLEIKIGNKRMYKIKDLPEFYTRMTRNEFYRYGDRLQFVHTRENFTTKSQELLDFIMKYSEMLKYAENTSKYSYYGSTLNHTSITLGESSLDEVFDILKKKHVILERDKSNNPLELLEKDPDIRFELTKISDEEYRIKPNKEIFGILIYYGKKYTYILEDSKLYRCSKNFTDSTIRLINIFKESYVLELGLGKDDLKDLYSVVMPKVGECVRLNNIDEEEMEQYRPKKLGVKVYLDFDDNDYIIADVKFCYGDEEFNPLEPNINIQNARNNLAESKSLNIIRKTGFMLDTKNLRFILPDNDKIYNFLANDIELYMQKFEVLATENFKSKEIRKPKISSIGVKVENNLLSIDLSKINVDTKELKDIMSRYQLKKKYYRLKDGSFINLEENSDIDFLDKLFAGMDLDYKDLEQDTIKLPISRTLYLDELLKREKINASKNSEFKKVVTDLEQDNMSEDIHIPEEMDSILRDYQKTGFKWLKVLDAYHFGGILADDMGLGKTLQIISLILDYIKTTEDKKTSLVVCPSSLTLNWLNEVKKFAPELKVGVVRGNANERKQTISDVDNYDLVITSYDSLKRDISIYEEKNYTFRYIIADEAQYMKNSTTQNAKAIKKLNGITRFALTGTPIENSLAELWSIFDFVMPGYLFGYNKFKKDYESPIVKDNDEKSLSRLKMLIAPFILRRNKKDVLTELPEKTITVLNNQMNEEQEKIYLSHLAQAKEEVANEIKYKWI